MSVKVPLSYNMLSNLDFVLIIPRLPQVSFWGQSANLPSIDLPMATQETMLGPIPVHGLQPRYNDLFVEFALDENLDNYMELYNWINSIGVPDDLADYETFAATMTDISLILLDSNKNPNLEITYEAAVPFQLSGNLFTSMGTDVDYLKATVGFKSRKFFIKKLK